ncbi:MAG: tRNA glutamyl-Q(34) synthetase GluQRS [Burkholderiaceae bacterium]|jgi:glutamyl-Q tRNA(Asp) synthetase|nr:tRNA glutamyl-Q(34) synthetase GluQRS [Burkholderiaceae bacterium]
MPAERTRYVGRFAPSPTGPLHAGSLVAALASSLDARAHGGRWLLRIEDLDAPREMPGAARSIIETLARLGFRHDAEIVYQSQRHDAYRQAFDRLVADGHVYPCGCTRREIADSITSRGRTLSGAEKPYPGTCRHGMPFGRSARSWRVRVGPTPVRWVDRRVGLRCDRLDEQVGDFVLRRADGQWAYQLAVVVDDDAQGVTDIVRGADLLDSTARQLHLRQLLAMPAPRHLHVPVVVGPDGTKLSKQTGAPPIEASRPSYALDATLEALGLGRIGNEPLDRWWSLATGRWARAAPDRDQAESRPGEELASSSVGASDSARGTENPNSTRPGSSASRKTEPRCARTN